MALLGHSEPRSSTSKFEGPSWSIRYDNISLRILFQILVSLVIMFVTLDLTPTLGKPKPFAKMDLTF